MLKVGRERKRKERKKDRKKDKKHTNSIARIRARASRPAVSRAWNFTTQPRTMYKTRSISEYYVRNNYATHRLKNTSHTVSNANKTKKKSNVNFANIIVLQKKIKAEESVTFQNIFSSLADFRDVVSVLPAARLATKTLLIAFIEQKGNRPWEIKESFLAFWLSSSSSTQH